MKPFVLKQHDKDFAAVRELRDEELKTVGGGYRGAGGGGAGAGAGADGTVISCATVTVTPNGDGSGDPGDGGD